jgi:oligopeptide transport system substrate-binding protein
MKRLNERRPFAFLLLVALILPILAACGGGGGGAATTPAPGGAATQEAPAAPEATEAPATEGTEAPATEATAPAGDAATAEATGGAGGGVLRFHDTAFPVTLDPQDSSIANEIAVLLLNYEGLTRFDENLETVPGAAESWESNEDATEFTFTLRENLTYSDGSPLTAQDFVNAARRSLDPRGIVGNYQSTLFMIKGADAILSTEVPTDEAKVPELFNQLGVTAVDEQTVKFELIKPTPYFPALMGLWVMFPAKQDLVEAGGELWWEDAANQVGNGPFQLTNIDVTGNLIEMEANENYWRGRPKLDGVQFKTIEDLSVALEAYKSGEVDVATPDPNDHPTIKADPVLGPEFAEYPGSCTTTVAFNMNKAPFDNPKVREAFAYGFDRESYVRDAAKNADVPTLTWIPPGFPGYDEDETRFAYDPEKAKAALAEAGYPNGEGLPEIKIPYVGTNPGSQSRTEYLVQMYQNSLGVTMIPEPLDATTLNAYRSGGNETYPQILNGEGWCADYPDPQNWLSIFWNSRSEYAQTYAYNNPEFDELVNQADIETDPEKRAELYAQAQELLIADVPMVMRSNNQNQYLIKSYVKGMVFTPQDAGQPGLYDGLLNVTMEK